MRNLKPLQSTQELVPKTELLHSQASEGTSNSSYFRVFGMSCPSCAKTIQTALSKHLKVKTSVDFDSNLIQINKEKLSVDSFRPLIEKLGFYVSSVFESFSENTAKETHQKILTLRASIAIFFSMWILVFSLSRYGLNLHQSSTTNLYIEYAISILFMPILLFSAVPFYRMAVLGARVRDYNMDSFISLEIIACILLSIWSVLNEGSSYLDSLSMSLSLLLIGKLMFFKMQSSQTLSLDKLTGDLGTKVVRIQTDKQIRQEVELKDIQKNDLIEIQQGGFASFDGELVSSSGEFDRLKFYGTSQEVHLKDGSKILAGYQLISSTPIVFKATKLLKEREIDQLYLSAQKALIRSHQNRSFSDRLVDVFIRITPFVAVTTLFLSRLWLESWLESAVVALSVLIILCPCAFAFAPPITFGALSSSLFQIGIQLRSKKALEHKVPRIILFDKNGTLTQPKINLEKSIFYDLHQDLALQIAAEAESGVDHPIAEAFKQFKTTPYKRVKQTLYDHKGLEAKIEGVGKVLLGNRALMIDKKIDIPDSNEALYMAIDNKLVSLFKLRYEVSNETIESLKILARDGYQLGILTGDSNLSSLPIELFEADLIKTSCQPQDKLEFMETLVKQGKSVAYIGDGVNDSLVMARSSLSFSVSNASQAAKASATASLLEHGIAKLPQALRLLKTCQKFLKINLFYACVYNALALSFALFGFFNPATALFSMASSSILILLSLAMFYYYIQIPRRPRRGVL